MSIRLGPSAMCWSNAGLNVTLRPFADGPLVEEPLTDGWLGPLAKVGASCWLVANGAVVGAPVSTLHALEATTMPEPTTAARTRTRFVIFMGRSCRARARMEVLSRAHGDALHPLLACSGASFRRALTSRGQVLPRQRQGQSDQSADIRSGWLRHHCPTDGFGRYDRRMWTLLPVHFLDMYSHYARNGAECRTEQHPIPPRSSDIGQLFAIVTHEIHSVAN